MTRVVIIVRSDTVSAVYSDDKNVKVEIFDFDGSEEINENEASNGLYKICPTENQ